MKKSALGRADCRRWLAQQGAANREIVAAVRRAGGVESGDALVPVEHERPVVAAAGRARVGGRTGQLGAGVVMAVMGIIRVGRASTGTWVKQSNHVSSPFCKRPLDFVALRKQQTPHLHRQYLSPFSNL